MHYYVSGCVFTARFPTLSRRLRDYAAARSDMEILRCCFPGWKVREYEEKMPPGELRDAWTRLPHTHNFTAGDAVWSVCPNCSNLIEECHPGVSVYSLWEWIDADRDFPFPDYSGMTATIQDCWRCRDRSGEHRAVRSLLTKMHIRFVETEANRADSDFCGATLYRPPMERNARFAPKHYVEGAEGKFIPHTEEEQARLMRERCARYTTDTVICYCHYCLEGLLLGGADGRHLAQLLFPD